MYSFWKEKQHTILSITCIPRILLSCTSTLINQVNKMLWICSIQFVYNCISSFQSLQVLKSSDLKPYIVFVYPPNMEKLRQMQKNFYPDTTITVRNLSVLSFFLSLCVCVCVHISFSFCHWPATGCTCHYRQYILNFQYYVHIWAYGWKSTNKKFSVVKKSELYRTNVINMSIDLKDLILWYINNCNIFTFRMICWRKSLREVGKWRINMDISLIIFLSTKTWTGHTMNCCRKSIAWRWSPSGFRFSGWTASRWSGIN